MRFLVTLSRREPKNTDQVCTVTVDADSNVDFNGAPGFVSFTKDGEIAIMFNISKIESIGTVKELK